MKIHLVLKKEDIDTVQMDDNKIAVVFDVLLATSTITACLHYGAKQVIPVMDGTEALQEVKKFADDDVALVGEYNGITIDGFLNPAPLALKKHVAGKTVVLSTTNGTVAIRKSAPAKKVYIATLLNGKAVSQQIADTYDQETIVVVCSGSSNQFCLEDFYGAGYFIKLLTDEYGAANLTDSALAAKMFYQNVPEGQDVLIDSRIGQLLEAFGFQDDLDFVKQQGVLPVIPRLKNEKYIMEEKTNRRKMGGSFNNEGNTVQGVWRPGSFGV